MENDKSNLDNYLEKNEENISFKKSNDVSSSFQTIGVLSIIGSSLWIVLYLFAFAFLADLMSAFIGGLSGIITFIMLFLIGLNVLKIIGIAQMFRNKSIGFILYMAGNVIHTGLGLFGYFNGQEKNNLTLLFCLLSVVFIILVTTNKDKVINQ